MVLVTVVLAASALATKKATCSLSHVPLSIIRCPLHVDSNFRTKLSKISRLSRRLDCLYSAKTSEHCDFTAESSIKQAAYEALAQKKNKEFLTVNDGKYVENKFMPVRQIKL